MSEQFDPDKIMTHLSRDPFPSLDGGVECVGQVVLGCSVSVVVGRRTRDRDVASSVPGRCIAG